MFAAPTACLSLVMPLANDRHARLLIIDEIYLSVSVTPNPLRLLLHALARCEAMSIDRFGHKVDRKVEKRPARLQRIKVITGVERRRARSREEKRAILTEGFEDGVVISEVAPRYGRQPQQLFTWRNEFRKRGLARFQSNCATIEPPAFAPMMIARWPGSRSADRAACFNRAGQHHRRVCCSL